MARSYQIGDCPVARTLDLIGERWTILLLRDLLLQGPRRFQDFEASFPGVAPNTLSARLKAMEENGLVQRQLYNERPPRLEYVLTERGKSLGPVVKAMRDWGSKHTEGRRATRAAPCGQTHARRKRANIQLKKSGKVGSASRRAAR